MNNANKWILKVFSIAVIVGLFFVAYYYLFQRSESEDYMKKIREFSHTTLEKAFEGIKNPNYRTSSIVLLFMDDPKHSEEDVLELLKATPLYKGDVGGYWINDTALLTVVRLQYLSVVKYLIEQGADVNKTYSAPVAVVTGPPLLIAVENRDLPMIKYLVEQGANIYQEVDTFFDGNIITPFKRAQELGYDEIIDLFKTNEG